MKMTTTLLACGLALGTLAGCSEHSHVVFGDNRDGVTIQGDTVQMRARDQPRATLHADGTFRVDGQVMEATPAQREQLAAYHAAIIDFVEHSVEVGKDAGLAAAAAARDAVKARLSGPSDTSVGEQIARDIKASVSDNVSVLCDQLDAMYAHQQAVVETRFRPFEPYANLTADSASRCREKLPRD